MDALPPGSKRLGDRLAVTLATGLGVGFVPFAPGTAGSLWGLLFVWGLLRLPLISARLIVSLLTILVGIPLCDRAAKVLGKKDPGAVVFDEIAAFPVVFLPVLLDHVPFNWLTAAAGFLLFRAFDITKPWPARRVERWPGGLGIVADDIVAAVYAGGFLTLIYLALVVKSIDN